MEKNICFYYLIRTLYGRFSDIKEREGGNEGKNWFEGKD